MKKKTFWKCLSKDWIPHFITQSPLSNMKQYLRSSKSNAITTVNDLSWLENFYSFFGKNKESFRSENHMRLFLIIEFVSLEVFICFSDDFSLYKSCNAFYPCNFSANSERIWNISCFAETSNHENKIQLSFVLFVQKLEKKSLYITLISPWIILKIWTA